MKLNLQTLTFAVLVIVLPVQGWLCKQVFQIKVSVARLEIILSRTAAKCDQPAAPRDQGVTLARDVPGSIETQAVTLGIYEKNQNPNPN